MRRTSMNVTKPCRVKMVQLVLMKSQVSLFRDLRGEMISCSCNFIYIFGYRIIFFIRRNEQVTIARALTDGRVRTAQTTSTSVSRTRVNTAEPATTPSIVSTVPAPVVSALFCALLRIMPSGRR